MSRTTAPHALRADALTLGYGGVDIVHELDLTVPDGQVTVIVGANGCGKSTLLRGLARLLKPRSGAVELDDLRARGLGNLRAEGVARVGGDRADPGLAVGPLQGADGVVGDATEKARADDVEHTRNGLPLSVDP